ncbi:hypothetical protein BG011_000592 [Mortierella polycephala]|uniref:Uncharacterized protein n=1 Tax=Mortierella polycephala TaxID=41804 RepID=A0A9P6PLT1_9FUNG|nr:hypothetical protein BG011_000592 [Mortierella polycephala]
MSDPVSKTLRDEYDRVQAQLDEASKTKDNIWKKRNELFDERKRLQKELDAEYQYKKTANDVYFTAILEHSKFMQEEQPQNWEEIQQEKQQELEGSGLAVAREERELAEIPAFQGEIMTCERAATETSNVPSGEMLTRKAEKIEEVFYTGRDIRSKNNRAPKYKKGGCNSLKLPQAVMEQLYRSSLEKRNTFKAHQAKFTVENKRTAEERIAKLTLMGMDSIKAVVDKTEIVAVIEAAAYNESRGM